MTFRTVDLEEHDASRRQLERDRLADCPEWKPFSVDERRDEERAAGALPAARDVTGTRVGARARRRPSAGRP